MEEEHKEDAKTRPHTQRLRGESKPKGTSRDKQLGVEEKRWKQETAQDWRGMAEPPSSSLPGEWQEQTWGSPSVKKTASCAPFSHFPEMSAFGPPGNH